MRNIAILCIFLFFRLAYAGEVLVGGQHAWEYDQGNSSGYFQTFDALSTSSQRVPRKVHVYLPRSYRNESVSYPVIYMNDGQTAFFPEGNTQKSWRMQDILDSTLGQIPNVIVVAMVSVDREREYTHEALLNRPCCDLPVYADEVANGIVPFINANYRTKADRQSTTILGSSHGGLAAFYIATRYPRVFGNAITMSSSYWVGVETAIGERRHIKTSTLVSPVLPLLKDPTMRPRLWMDWGLVRSGGIHNSLFEKLATSRGNEMVSVLSEAFGYQKNVELFSQEDANGEHDEFSWARRLPQVLKIFYPLH